MDEIITSYRTSSITPKGEDFTNYLFNVIHSSLKIEGSSFTLDELKVLFICHIAINGISSFESDQAKRMLDAYNTILSMIEKRQDFTPHNLIELANIISGGKEEYSKNISYNNVINGANPLSDEVYKIAKTYCTNLTLDERLAKITDLCCALNTKCKEIKTYNYKSQYAFSAWIHNIVATNCLWGEATGRMARLLMHFVQLYCSIPLTYFANGLRQEYLDAVLDTCKDNNSDALTNLIYKELVDHSGEEIKRLTHHPGVGRKRLSDSMSSKIKNAKEKLVECIRNKPKHTARSIALELNIPRSIIDRALLELKAENKIRHIGPRKGGSWEPID